MYSPFLELINGGRWYKKLGSSLMSLASLFNSDFEIERGFSSNRIIESIGKYSPFTFSIKYFRIQCFNKRNMCRKDKTNVVKIQYMYKLLLIYICMFIYKDFVKQDICLLIYYDRD